MPALLIALMGGSLELLLLYLLIRSVTNEKPWQIVLFFVLKLAVLAAAFVPVILFLRDDLLLFGIGLAGVLVIGSIAIFLIRSRSFKEDKKA